MNMTMKKNLKKIYIATASLMMLTAIACAPVVETTQSAPAVDVSEQGSEAAEQPHLAAVIDTENGLTEAEMQGLLWMREEEKLAGDVYRFLYDQWGSTVFSNIAESEDMHTDSVLALLTAYGIEDPANAEAGQFSNPELQALYDQLTAQGSQSLEAAYMVGGAIEEIDILDLETRIAETDKADILLVYENLMAGSENHLRAFVRVYENQIRQNYAHQYLTQERYDGIIAGGSSMGNGIGGQSGGQGYGQGAGQGKP